MIWVVFVNYHKPNILPSKPFERGIHNAYDFHTFEFLKHRWESQFHTVLWDVWNIFAPDSTSPPPGQPAVLVISLGCISHPSLPRSAEPGCSTTLGDSRSTAAGVRGLIVSTAPTAPQLRFSNKEEKRGGGRDETELSSLAEFFLYPLLWLTKHIITNPPMCLGIWTAIYWIL